VSLEHNREFVDPHAFGFLKVLLDTKDDVLVGGFNLFVCLRIAR